MFTSSWDTDAEMCATRRHTLQETATGPPGGNATTWWGADGDTHAIMDQPGVFGGDDDFSLDDLLASVDMQEPPPSARGSPSRSTPPGTVCPSSPAVYQPKFGSPCSIRPLPPAAPELFSSPPVFREPTMAPAAYFPPRATGLPRTEHHAYCVRPIVTTRAAVDAEFEASPLRASVAVVDGGAPLPESGKLITTSTPDRFDSSSSSSTTTTTITTTATATASNCQPKMADDDTTSTPPAAATTTNDEAPAPATGANGTGADRAEKRRLRRLAAKRAEHQEVLRDTRDKRRDELLVAWANENGDFAGDAELVAEAHADVDRQLAREFTTDANGFLTLASLGREAGRPHRAARLRGSSGSGSSPETATAAAAMEWSDDDGEGSEDSEDSGEESEGDGEFEHDNDDHCAVCEEEEVAGDVLVCCDFCSQSVHYQCLDADQRPRDLESEEEPWQCPDCAQTEMSDDDDDDDDDDGEETAPEDEEDGEGEEEGDIAFDLSRNAAAEEESWLRQELERRRGELGAFQYSVGRRILEWLSEDSNGRQRFTRVMMAVVCDDGLHPEDHATFELMLSGMGGALSAEQRRAAKDLLSLCETDDPAEFEGVERIASPEPAEDGSATSATTNTIQDQPRIDEMLAPEGPPPQSKPAPAAQRQRQPPAGAADAAACGIECFPKPPVAIPAGEVTARLTPQAKEEGSCGADFGAASATLLSKGALLPPPYDGAFWMEPPTVRTLRDAICKAMGGSLKKKGAPEEFVRSGVSWALLRAPPAPQDGFSRGQHVWAFACLRVNTQSEGIVLVPAPSGCFTSLFPRTKHLCPGLDGVRGGLPARVGAALAAWGRDEEGAWCTDWRGLQQVEGLTRMGPPEGEGSEPVRLPTIDSRALYAEVRDLVKRQGLTGGGGGAAAAAAATTGGEKRGEKRKRSGGRGGKKAPEDSEPRVGEEERKAAKKRRKAERRAKRKAAKVEEEGEEGGEPDAAGGAEVSDEALISDYAKDCHLKKIPGATAALLWEEGWESVSEAALRIEDKPGMASDPPALPAAAPASLEADAPPPDLPAKPARKRKRAAKAKEGAPAKPAAKKRKAPAKPKPQPKPAEADPEVDDAAAKAPAKPRTQFDKQAAAKKRLAKTKQNAKAEHARREKRQKRAAEETKARNEAATAPPPEPEPPAHPPPKPPLAASPFAAFCEALQEHADAAPPVFAKSGLVLHGPVEGAERDALMEVLWDATRKVPGEIRRLILSRTVPAKLVQLARYVAEAASGPESAGGIRGVLKQVVPSRLSAHAYFAFVAMALRMHPVAPLPPSGPIETGGCGEAGAEAAAAEDEEEDLFGEILGGADEEEEGAEEEPAAAASPGVGFPAASPNPTAADTLASLEPSVGTKRTMAQILQSSESKVLPWLAAAVREADGDGGAFLEALAAEERKTEQMGIPCVLLLAWMMMVPAGLVARLAATEAS